MLNTSTPLDRLSHILTSESHQCDLLAQNIVEEREAIKRMALHEFLSINQTRVGILECLGALKEEFDECVRTLATTYQVPEANRTLTDVLHRSEGPGGEAVLRQYERLAEKARALKQDIAVNQLLIQNVQSFLTRAADVRRSGAQEDELYSASGVRGTIAGPAVLLKRQG